MLRFTREGDTQDFHYLCSGDTYAFDVEPYLGLIGPSRKAETQSTADATRDVLVDTVVDDEIESSDGGW